MDRDAGPVGIRRVLAAFVDLGLFALLAFALFIVVSEKQPNWGLHLSMCSTAGGLCTDIGDTTYVASGGRLALFASISIGYLTYVFIFRRGRTGRSVGMNAVGVRVVDERGEPPGFVRSAVRSAAGMVDYLPFCVPIVGLITIATSPFQQRVGDMVAETFVVKDDVAIPPGHLLGDHRTADGRSDPGGLLSHSTLDPPVGSNGEADGRTRFRILVVARWVATSISALLALALLGMFWTVTYWVGGEYCGTVISPEGSCGAGGRVAFLALTIGAASVPVLVLAGPFWVAELLSRRRARRSIHPVASASSE